MSDQAETERIKRLCWRTGAYYPGRFLCDPTIEKRIAELEADVQIWKDAYTAEAERFEKLEECIRQLADQQAIPDDFWKKVLEGPDDE